MTGDLGDAFAGQGRTLGRTQHRGIADQRFGVEAERIAGPPAGGKLDSTDLGAVQVEALAAEATNGEGADDGEGAGTASDRNVADGIVQFVPKKALPSVTVLGVQSAPISALRTRSVERAGFASVTVEPARKGR